MARVWKDPTSAWTTGEIAERPIDDHRDPLAIGRETRAFKAPTLPVGRLRYYYKWPGHGGSLWSRLLIGALIGLVFGLVIAIPANRLDGFYYSLLTIGVVELCRVYVVQSRELGSATGGLYGVPSYLPESWTEDGRLLLGYYACFALMILALVLFRLVNGQRLGRVLRMAPEKREAFAEATGVDFRTARMQVFLISSAGLGFIGGFYITHFRGISPNMFSFDTVLLGLAMLVIGGLGRAEGAVVGTLIVVFIDRVLLDFGPIRFVLIGALMLLTVLFLRDGLFGMKAQFRAWRDKKKSEARSSRAEKGGEMLPEEATETADKDSIYFRRFDKMQRDYLKTLISDELIREYEEKPLGQHSEALERGAELRPPPAAERRRRDDGGQAVRGLPDRGALRPARGSRRGSSRTASTRRSRTLIVPCSAAASRTCSSPDRLAARVDLPEEPPLAEAKLFGYADKITVNPGDEITFHVNADGTATAEAQLVRLMHGAAHPAGPSF